MKFLKNILKSTKLPYPIRETRFQILVSKKFPVFKFLALALISILLN